MARRSGLCAASSPSRAPVAPARYRRHVTEPRHLAVAPDATRVPVRALQPGDLITELDTPGGPWYLVAGVDLDRGVLVLGTDEVDVPVDAPDAVVLRRGGVPSTGVFRAVVTTDAEAQRRSGQEYTAARLIDPGCPDGPLYEIQFADREWMLAVYDDLRGAE